MDCLYRSQLGKEALTNGDFKIARDYFELILNDAKKIKNKRFEGDACNLLGRAYHCLGEFTKATELFQLGLSIAKNTGNKDEEGTIYNNLGAAYCGLGEFKKAMEPYQLGLSIFKNTGNKIGEGTVYNNLGVVYTYAGEFKKATELSQRGLRISKETGNKDTEAEYNNLGAAYYCLGEFKKAIELFNRGLRIAQSTGNKDTGGMEYINLGHAYHCLNDFEKAIEFSQLGLTIAKKTENKDLLGRGYSILGDVSFSLGDFEKAIEFYKLSLTIAKETGNKHLQGHGYIQLGDAYQSLHDSQKAIELYEQGLSILEKIGHKPAEPSTYGALADAFRSLGDFSKAEGFFKSKIKVVEEMRVLLQEKDEWKISFRNKHDFTGLVALQLQEGKITEALFTAEEGRAQALVDLMEWQYEGKKSIASSSKREMEVILSNISSHISSPTLFLGRDRDRDRDTCHEAVYLWLLLKGQQPQFVRKEIRGELKTLIDRTYKQIGVKRRGRSDNRSPDEPEDEEIDDLFDRGTEASASSSQQDEGGALKALYEVVIAPISHLIKGDELIIVPDGSLFLIPYAALVDQHFKYLSETLRIRLAPSLTCLRLLAECPEERHSTSGALLVGNPWVETVRIDNKTFKQLPGAEKEVKMIGQILNNVPLTGKKATKEQVLSRLNPVSLIHIAAHGRTENGEIILSPNLPSVGRPKVEDFLLTMADVLGAKLHAKLVVLSCCHSGQGPIKAEGVVGIARAFLGAGARSVIATLWAINDEATLEFMRHFYEHLVAGQSASKSLHQAMKCIRESGQYKAVKHWAPFVLIGDDVTLNFSQ